MCHRHFSCASFLLSEACGQTCTIGLGMYTYSVCMCVRWVFTATSHIHLPKHKNPNECVCECVCEVSVRADVRGGMFMSFQQQGSSGFDCGRHQSHDPPEQENLPPHTSPTPLAQHRHCSIADITYSSVSATFSNVCMSVFIFQHQNMPLRINLR